MIVAKTLEEFIQARESLQHQESIGFVPTMGALHQGHISLVEHSVAKCKHTIVSIFVNPTQFNNPQDLATYPRTLEADCALLEASGVDIAFAPRVIDIYPTPDERVFDLEYESVLLDILRLCIDSHYSNRILMLDVFS